MSAIAVENVSKHWTTADGQVRAVDGLSFAFDEGTLTCCSARRDAASRRRCACRGLETADEGRIRSRP